jgi:hypothetical protein
VLHRYKFQIDIFYPHHQYIFLTIGPWCHSTVNAVHDTTNLRTAALCWSCILIFRRFLRITKSYYWLLPVRPSVCQHEQLGCNWTDCHGIGYLGIFRKSVEKIWVSLKSDKNNDYCKCRPINSSDHISVNSS